MAKIKKIGNDQQAPFWHLVVGWNQAVTQDKNKIPHEQYNSDPQDC